MCAEESTTAESEPNPELGTRQNRIQLIESYLIPHLDNANWKEKYEPDTDEVDNAVTMLATEYYDMAIPAMKSFVVLIALLLLTDYLVMLDAQIYGLFISIWASIFMVFPSLKGRFVIATLVQGEPSEALHRLQAQEMVTANTGFFFLGAGFVVQVLSAQFFTNSEVITANILGNAVPWWITLGLLIITAFINSKIFSKLRDNRLDSREVD